MRSYFKRIKDILTYYDYEPLILFVALYDIIMVGASIFGKDEWGCNAFQTFDVYSFLNWMFMIYWFGAILIILCINSPKWLTRFITIHTIQALIYSTDYGSELLYNLITDFNDVVLYYLSFYLDLLRQLFWMYIWIWILFQMKKKELYQRLRM